MRSKVSIKLLAILMIMAMLLSLIPVAMAEDGEVWVEADAGEGGDGSDEEIPEVPLTDTQEDIDLDEEETADVEEGIYLEAENDPLGEEQTDGDEADEGEFILFGALGSPDEVWVDASAEEPGDGSESSPFATIQEGINEVAAGGMVKVKAGTYTESVTVNKALTLESVDGAEDTTIDADGEDIAIKITADGVTVDGFTVTGANSSYEGAVFLDRVEDCTIKNNTVKDNERSGIYMKQADNNTIEDNTISGNTLGIHLERASQTGKSCNHNTIKGNTIENNSSTGISLNTSYGQVNAATGNEFLDNTIIGNGNYGFNIQGGVWVANTIEGNTISGHQQYGIHNNGGAQNNTIKGNTIDDNNRGGYSGAGIQSGDGICLKNHDSFNFDETRATFGNTIESNTITNHWNGINLAGSTWFGNGDYWHYENTIKDNTISSNNGNGIVVKASINNLIEGNTITGNSRNGISFEEEDPTSSHINGASDNTVKENKIVNNATSRGYGINASEKSTGNTAILNWWGSVNGPGEDGANGVSSNVAYDPWYADEELKTIASNKPVINVTQMTTHETIQAAINAASAGDTIEVAAGEYSDSTMTINKPLTLKGANAGTPAADGSGEAPEERGPETILTSSGPFVIKPAASNITIDGFKFTGGKGRLIDTYEDSDNLRITNCIFDTPNGAADGGVIQLGGGSKQNLQIDHNLFMGAATSNWLYLGGTNYNNLQINNNDFKGTGKGIFQTGSDFVNIELKNNYFGSGITTGVNFGSLYNPTITGNHFDGLEYVGLQIGTEGGKLYNNTFENFIGRDFGDDLIIGAGIDLFGGQWNTLTCSGLEIHDNTFTGNIQGINIRSGVGGEGEATETKIYNNRIEDCKREGIRIANSGDITGFGSFSITNNTFINNNIQVAAEPLAEDYDF
ncbi:MAG: right-handed parallel beta-helix repeat-containing protein, partial [Dethiobacteria bacterium]